MAVRGEIVVVVVLGRYEFDVGDDVTSDDVIVVESAIGVVPSDDIRVVKRISA